MPGWSFTPDRTRLFISSEKTDRPGIIVELSSARKYYVGRESILIRSIRWKRIFFVDGQSMWRTKIAFAALQFCRTPSQPRTPGITLSTSPHDEWWLFMIKPCCIFYFVARANGGADGGLTEGWRSCTNCPGGWTRWVRLWGLVYTCPGLFGRSILSSWQSCFSHTAWLIFKVVCHTLSGLVC